LPSMKWIKVTWWRRWNCTVMNWPTRMIEMEQ
jgi:hypothetical protein